MYRETWKITSISLVMLFLASCSVASEHDPIINDMENAYIEVEQKEGDTHVERNDAVTHVVQKYFPLGMKTEEAFKRLNTLDEDGFHIWEYRHEGRRVWPDGELKPYLDEGTRRNLQQHYPKGVSEFVAKKQYGRQSFIITKHAVVSFRVVDGSGVITNVKGAIWLTGL